MSVCNCPTYATDEHRKLVKEFLNGTSLEDWNLLSVADMYNAGNSMASINSVVPFRGSACPRTLKCCGMCTRRCKTRCVQDCLHRLYMWRMVVNNTPERDRECLPLNIRLICTQKFEDHEVLSWAVGDILSSATNTALKEYMKNANLRRDQNPYKIDYAPRIDVDPNTGRRIADPDTGELRILTWPRTGLCPYCLPKVTVDTHYAKRSGVVQNR